MLASYGINCWVFIDRGLRRNIRVESGKIGKAIAGKDLATWLGANCPIGRCDRGYKGIIKSCMSPHPAFINRVFRSAGKGRAVCKIPEGNCPQRHYDIVSVNDAAANDAVTPAGIDCCTILRTMPEPDEVLTNGVAGPEVVLGTNVSVAGVPTKLI